MLPGQRTQKTAIPEGEITDACCKSALWVTRLLTLDRDLLWPWTSHDEMPFAVRSYSSVVSGLNVVRAKALELSRGTRRGTASPGLPIAHADRGLAHEGEGDRA